MDAVVAFVQSTSNLAERAGLSGVAGARSATTALGMGVFGSREFSSLINNQNVSGFDRSSNGFQDTFTQRAVGAQASPLFNRIMAFERAMGGSIGQLGDSPTEMAMKAAMNGEALSTEQIKALSPSNVSDLIAKKTGLSLADSTKLATNRSFAQAQAEITGNDNVARSVLLSQAGELFRPLSNRAAMTKLRTLGITDEGDLAVAMSVLSLNTSADGKKAAFTNLGDKFTSLSGLSVGDIQTLSIQASADIDGRFSNETLASIAAQRGANHRVKEMEKYADVMKTLSLTLVGESPGDAAIGAIAKWTDGKSTTSEMMSTLMGGRSRVDLASRMLESEEFKAALENDPTGQAAMAAARLLTDNRTDQEGLVTAFKGDRTSINGAIAAILDKHTTAADAIEAADKKRAEEKSKSANADDAGLTNTTFKDFVNQIMELMKKLTSGTESPTAEVPARA